MRQRRSRSGFTLVELLVAIAIMIALVLLAVGLSPNTEKRHVTDAADQLQTYLASARSRALRDNVLTGVRLLPDQNNPSNYSSFQFIQAPEPYAPVGVTMNISVAGLATLPNNVTAYLLAGDLLELPNQLVVRRVTGVAYDSTNNVTNIQLTSAPPAAPMTLTPTSANVNAGFRFIREPRPLMGEQVLQIPNNVLVMANGNGSLNIPTSFAGGNFDIIFSPSGQVTNASQGRIVLWVQSTISGQKTLLCIYSRTGGVASHPVDDTPAGNPYSFTQDGRSSGQ